MSYDIKLTNPADHRIVEEDHIIENDLKTVILNRPMSSADAKVRINDFERDSEFQTEILFREDVSSQFNGNNDSIFVSHGPIFNGLKIGQLATSKLDVIVKMKVKEEDVSEQFSGTDDYFITEGRPILKANEFDSNTLVNNTDVIVKLNGTALTVNDIDEVDATTGKVVLKITPSATDVITVTYYFRVKVKSIDALNSRIVLKEKPITGQNVKVYYYGRVNDGWEVVKSKRSLFENARDIVFSNPQITNRVLVSFENATSQITGNTNIFYTKNKPLLPLYQNFGSTITETLNNAAVVLVNGIRQQVIGLDAETGELRIPTNPKIGDNLQISYYYQDDVEPDRISIDYAVEKIYCLKCAIHPELADYYLDPLGNYEKVENEDKLVQDLRKITITVKGSDHVAAWYGTTFEVIIGTVQIPDFVKTRISSEIVNALTNLKNAQIQQEEYQEMTPNEFLDFISSITVTQNETEPTYYHTEVNVVTQAGTPFTVEQQVTAEQLVKGSV